MANVSVTNTFTSGTTILSGEVNQNFTDIINGTSDGTKDFNINALTASGTITFDGLTASRGLWTNASQVLATNGVDSAKILFGTGSDSEMYHDGTNLHIDPEASGATTAFIINESGSDVDLRVEGDTATQLLVVDASADSVEIGTTTQGNIVKINSTGVNLQASMDLIGSATSDITFNTDKFTVAGATGNTVVAGTLTVTGATTQTGALTVAGLITANGGVTLGAGDDLIGSSTSDITINTDKFTVAGASGNTAVGGTLAVTGATTFTGAVTANGGITLGAGDDLIGSSTSDITFNTNKFTVAGASGNTVIAGTLTQTGVATFTAQPIMSSLTASLAVFTDGSKGLVSNAITGTGNVVMSVSPTLTGTITAAAANFSGNVGVGGSRTDGELHVIVGSAGSVSAPGAADIAVFESSTDDGISILVPDASESAISMGSPTDATGADITWKYSTTAMKIRTKTAGGTMSIATGNATEAISIDASQAVTFAGATTFTGAMTANGSITLGAGDDLIGSATSDITFNTNKFTVAGATGNTVIAGTLGVTGVGTFTAEAVFNGGLALGDDDNITLGASSDATIDYVSASDSILINNATQSVSVDIGTGGNLIILTGATLETAAPTTSIASLNLPHGTAPTSPNNGDMWTETDGVHVFINGTEYTLDQTAA